MSNTNVITTKKLTQIALFGAISTILFFIEIPLFFMPPFIKLDFSNVATLFAGFILGPVEGIAVCLIKNVIHFIVGGANPTAGVGEIFDFFTSSAFILFSSLIYKKHHTKKGAVIGSFVGAVAYSLISLPLNLYFTYPIYAELFGGMENVLSAYRKILPSVENIFHALCVFNLPFTFFKGILLSVIVIYSYKPLMSALSSLKIVKK